MHEVEVVRFSVEKRKPLYSEQGEGRSDFSTLEKVVLVKQGVKIQKNPYTGQLEGMPEEWIGKFQFPFAIDHSKTVNTRTLPQEIRPEFELPPEIIDFMAKSVQRSVQLSRIKESDQAEKTKEIKEATQFFGIKTNINSSLLDVLSKVQSVISIDQGHEILDVITSYGNEIYQSKYERQFLTTSQFRKKLEKVSLLQEQPAIRFKFLQELGKGSMCKVYRVMDRSNSSQFYAVRIITIQDRKYLQKIKQEIAVMELCQSKNIITYHFSYYFQKTLFMFIEYMEFGALNKFVAAYFKNISENVIAYIIREILKGLEVIHRRKQLHRDLKSDNILINQRGQIKISDFGYALQFTREKTTCRELAGTPAWMAPELIKKDDYNESVDIWSLGIILVELCEGQPKYLRMKPLIAMMLIASRPPETVNGRSRQLQDFLSKCLKKDPTLRSTAKQLLQHPFILAIGSGLQEKAQFLQMARNIQIMRV